MTKDQKARPTTARPNDKKEEETKATPRTMTKTTANTNSSQSAFKPLEIGDFDDPIAHAFHARVKLGGSNEAVIKDTDARKVGVQLVKTFKLATAKGHDLIELLTQSQEKTAAPKKDSAIPNRVRSVTTMAPPPKKDKALEEVKK